MTIDNAIKCLELAKQRGVKAVVLAYWEASMFDQKDDDIWEAACQDAEEHMNWSTTHDAIADIVNMDNELHTVMALKKAKERKRDN